MSLQTQAFITASRSLRMRIAVCAGGESDTLTRPLAWADEHRFVLARTPGWAEKWDAATAQGILDPGADASVISDWDILSAVRELLGLPAPEPEPEPELEEPEEETDEVL